MDNQVDNSTDYSEAFKSLLDSPLGAELIRTLKEDCHANIIADAEKAESQGKAFGLLKEASGVIKAIGHLQFRASSPKDEGSKRT